MTHLVKAFSTDSYMEKVIRGSLSFVFNAPQKNDNIIMGNRSYLIFNIFTQQKAANSS